MVLLYHVLHILAPFLTPIRWALLLAWLFYPVYEWFCARLHGRATWAALLATVVVTTLAVLPLVYVGILAVTETVHAYQKALAWVQAGGLRTVPKFPAQISLIGTVSQELLGRMVVAYGDLQTPMLEGGQAVGGFLMSGLGGLARNTLEFMTDFVIMLVTMSSCSVTVDTSTGPCSVPCGLRNRTRA